MPLGEPRSCPPIPSHLPPRSGGRRQLPPTPTHPSSLNLAHLPTICITHSPATPGRKEVEPPTNFPRLEPSPSHGQSSCPPSTFPRRSDSLSSVHMVPGSGPKLGVSPSRVSHLPNTPRWNFKRYFCVIPKIYEFVGMSIEEDFSLTSHICE